MHEYLTKEVVDKITRKILPRHTIMSEALVEIAELVGRETVARRSLHDACVKYTKKSPGEFLAVPPPKQKGSVALPGYHHPEGHHVKGISTLVNAQGRTVAQWYKTNKDVVDRKTALKEALAEIPDLVVPKRYDSAPVLKVYDNDLLSIYPIGDPHIGMLAWGPESGENFDIKIASTRLHGAVKYLVNQGASTTKEALLINLGDFFHTDNPTNATNASHNKLDVDGRWAKLLRVGLALKVSLIDLALTRHKIVRVICEIGNHDECSAIFLSVALDAHYRNEPRVSVDLSPQLFHYHEFGKCLIGVHHGHTVKKPADLESLMAHDMPEAWGRSTYRAWYVGHIHHSRKYEERGCTVESFRTLAPKDAWHWQQGYRSRCDMTKIMLHREYGEVFRATVDASFLKNLTGGRDGVGNRSTRPKRK